MELYPSTPIQEAVCGDGFCDSSEYATCPQDCKPIDAICPKILYNDREKKGCLERQGVWVANEYSNGCPVPPYCVYEDDNEISETVKLAIIMKLEKVSIKVSELKEQADSLADYYFGRKDDARYKLWQTASKNFDSILQEIISMQGRINDSSDLKSDLKQFLDKVKSELKNTIQNLINGLSEVGK